MARQRQPIGHAGTSTAAQPPESTGDVYGSASTLSAERTTGWHVLDVTSYSQTDELDVNGWRFQSSTFTVGEYAWCLMLAPNGVCQGTAGWICFGLRCRRPCGDGAGAELDAMVRTTYCLLDQAGQPLPSSVKMDSVCTLSSMLQHPSCLPFMETQRFESCSYVKDNGFSVRCDVTLVRMWTSRLPVVVPPPDLHRHLGDLLASGVGADVTFKVGRKAFAAHRCVLAARLPAFKAELLGGPQKEGVPATKLQVRIHDIKPSVFKALLHFIYTDSLPEIDARDEAVMARRLLVAAQRYGLEGLKRICEDFLCI